MTRLAAVLVCAALAFGTSVSAPSIFSGHSTVAFTLEAPFDELFAASSNDPDASVAGRIVYADASGESTVLPHIRVSVRGHTSKSESECTFPKLKLRLEDDPPRDSLFAGLSTVKIGTHCGESTDDRLTRNNRLANERSPHREAFVYRVLDVLGVPTLKVRPARIEYRDTSSRAAPRNPIVRDALLLEDDDEAQERVGGEQPINEQEFSSAQQMLSREDAIAIAFGEALAGNFDWCLRFTPDDTYRCDARHPLWNVLAFERKHGRAAALVYDFDTSGMVAGRHLWFKDIFNARFAPDSSEAMVEVWSQLQRTRTLFARSDLDAARARFAARAASAYGALTEAGVDADGVRHITRYLDAFFAAMANDAVFYQRVIVRRGTRVWADAARTRDACPDGGPAPVGTPVGPSLAGEDTMTQVVVMDALWHWTGPNKCAAILNGPVWVDSSEISTDFP